MRRSRAHAPVLIGLFGVMVGLAWGWRPSYWYDEAATLSAATRDYRDLWRLLAEVDLVHGAYYLTMHPWVAVTGTSEFATRSFSALGLGVTCAGVVVVGRRLCGRGLGELAGLICALLPGLAWTGGEARGFAWACAGVVWWVVAALRLMELGRRRDWLLCLAAQLVAVHVFVLAVLMVPVLLVTGRRWGHRARLRTCLLAGTALCLPLLVVTKGQDQALGDTSQPTALMIAKLLVRQYFLSPRGPREPGPVWVAAVLLALACGLIAWRALTSERTLGRRRVMSLVLPWILVPNAAVLIWSWVVRPIYAERYLTFTAPALALLLAYGLLRLREQRGRQAALAGVVTLACVVVQVSQRAEGAKAEDHYRVLSEFVSEQQPAPVVFGVPSARGIAVAYPEAFAGIDAPNVGRSAAESATLWGTVHGPGQLRLRRLVEPGGRLVLLDLTDAGWPSTRFQHWLARRGCQPEKVAAAERFTAYTLRCW